MTQWTKIGLGLALAASLSITLAQSSDSGEIKMTAKKYEFSPSEITVKKGEHVKLIITSTDRDHGIKIAAFHVEEKLPKDQAVTVEFTPDQTGTFPFECSKFCGMGHRRMKGELVIE